MTHVIHPYLLTHFTHAWRCLCLVHTTCVHGPSWRPWTRASFLDTSCEHGSSRSAGAIVIDVIIMFYLQDGCPKWRPCNAHSPWRQAVCTGL